MGKTTLIAFVGNIQTSLPGHEQNIFTWLEAVMPPLLALFLKGQWLGNGTQLNALINQHWQIGKQIPDQLPHWSQFYANAVQDALWKANVRRKEILATMAQADAWYTDPEPEPIELTFTSPLVLNDASPLCHVRHCLVCKTVLPEASPLGGRRRLVCSNACRQRAKRRRNKQDKHKKRRPRAWGLLLMDLTMCKESRICSHHRAGKKPTPNPIFWQVIACLPPDILSSCREYRKAVDMFTPINPQREEIRAQAILDSLTDYKKAVDLFAPRSPQGEEIRAQVETVELAANANRNNGRSIMRVFKAIKPDRLPMVDESV
jgi:hypothetical protein